MEVDKLVNVAVLPEMDSLKLAVGLLMLRFQSFVLLKRVLSDIN